MRIDRDLITGSARDEYVGRENERRARAHDAGRRQVDIDDLRSQKREHLRLAKHHQREATALGKRIKKIIKQGRAAARLALREEEQETDEGDHG